MGRNPFWLGVSPHPSPRHLPKTSSAASDFLNASQGPSNPPDPTILNPASSEPCWDGEGANAGKTWAGVVTSPQHGQADGTSSAAPDTAGMDEDTQRGPFLEEKRERRSAEELGALMQEKSLLRRRTRAGALKVRRAVRAGCNLVLMEEADAL